MTMTPRPPRIPDSQPAPIAPAILIAAALCGLLILGALAKAFLSPDDALPLTAEQQLQIDSGLSFPPLAIDLERLNRSRQEHYVDPDLTQVEQQLSDLLSVVRKANLGQFPAEDSTDSLPVNVLDHQLHLLADEVLPATGAQGFHAVGTPIFQRCRQGLRDVLSALQRGELPLARATENPPQREFAMYRENCGKALPVLLQRNLITPDGRWAHEYAETLFDIIQHYRWADLIHTRFPTHRQLPPYELEIFARWRIEDPNAFSPEERRRFLSQSMPLLPEDYDLELASARIDVANQDLTIAAARFHNLAEMHPDNPVYRAISDELQHQIMLVRR